MKLSELPQKEYRGKKRSKGKNVVNGTVDPPIMCTDEKVNVQFVANYPTTENMGHFFLIYVFGIWPIDDDANSMLVDVFTLSILSKLHDNSSVCCWREIKRHKVSSTPGQTGQTGKTGQTKLTFKLDFPGDWCRAAFAILAMFLNTACPCYFWWFSKLSWEWSNTWRDKSLCLYFAFKSAVQRPALVTSVQLFVIQLCFDSPFHFIYWGYGEKCDF